MAVIAITDGFVLLGAANVSAFAKEIKITYSADIVETTMFGSVSKTRVVALKDYAIEFTINNDYAAAAVDSVLFPLVGTLVVVEIRPTSAARSTSNAAYVGTALLESYSPMSGTIGTLNTSSVVFKAASGVLQRLTV